MNKYEIRTQKKKSNIIKASLELFSEKGFNDVSIKEIAALANVSQVSIYNYFGSKEGLVTECANIVMKNTLEAAHTLLLENMNYKEKLYMALSLCSNQFTEALYQYFSETALEDTALLHMLTNSINEMKKKIYRDYIELGKQENFINLSISTSTILDYIESINKIGMDMHSEEIETKQQEILQLFLFGLIGKEQ